LWQGVQDLDFLSDPTAGALRIGSSEPIAAAIVSPVVDRLSQQYRRLTFHVLTVDTDALYRELAARSIDLALARVPSTNRGVLGGDSFP
jgi:DNA-binding transcriptional LysR family regulator